MLAYANDFALTCISNDNNELQTMLQLCYAYSQDWHYTFNPSKSIVLVFGESTRSRLAARAVRSWRIGDSPIQERNQANNFGIVWSVSGSYIAHISSLITLARSAFYAIQAVGPRFGLLHPLTSLKLYRAYSLSYGLEVISPTKTELDS